MGLPNCPKCDSEYTYEDGYMLVCPECFHEWSKVKEESKEEKEKVYRDSNGTVLQDGDSVTVIKDLKVKGSSDVLKRGTNIKNITLKEGDHDVSCKVPGFGHMELKTEFLKKI